MSVALRATCNQYIGKVYELEEGVEERLYKEGWASVYKLREDIHCFYMGTANKKEVHFFNNVSIPLVDLMYCKGIEKIYIPEYFQCEQLDFSENPDLKEIVIEEGTHIVSLFCQNVPNLERIVLPNKLTTLSCDRKILTQNQVEFLEKNCITCEFYY